MIEEYWNLIDREPFLSLTWELNFFHACSFLTMFMNRKIFDFTKIPDKTNDLIFLKIPKKKCFWTIFDHFSPMDIFSK